MGTKIRERVWFRDQRQGEDLRRGWGCVSVLESGSGWGSRSGFGLGVGVEFGMRFKDLSLGFGIKGLNLISNQDPFFYPFNSFWDL